MSVSSAPGVEQLQKFNHGRLRQLRGSTTSTTTTSSSNVSRNESLVSVPSLFQALGGDVKASKTGSQLAFTTADLQLPHIKGVLVTPPGIKNKRKVVRHGLMSAVASSDLLNNNRDDTLVDSKSKITSKDTPNNISNITLTGNASGLQLRARPTVTTILRQQHVLEKVEKKEKDKLDSLMVSNCASLHVDKTVKLLEDMELEETKAAEAKRLLQAKLAYERAIAASRKVADEKQKLADDMRQKEKEWQAKLDRQREMERERRRAMAEQLQKSNSDSKRAVGAMLRYKQLKASQVKQETEQLQAEARLKQQEEELMKQDRIQQIQAAKLALKKTKETMGNPNQFYRSIAIPETQIKLRLQKEEEKRRLQETRQKIQAAKQNKSVKLIRAMKKIQNFEKISKRHAQEQQEAKISSSSTKDKLQKSLSSYHNFSSIYSGTQRDINNNYIASSNKEKVQRKKGEIEEMVEELKRLKVENLQERNNEQYRARSAGPSFGSTVKIVGTRNPFTSSSTVAGSSIFNVNNKNKNSTFFRQHHQNNSSSKSYNR